MKITRLQKKAVDFYASLSTLRMHDDAPDTKVINQVNEIIQAVHQRGDRALLDYTNHLDSREVTEPEEFAIPFPLMEQALADLPAGLRKALDHASDRIRAYHQRQKLASWSYEDEEGVLLGQRVNTMDRVGVYVPGGKAAYPSSVLMNVIPAVVAGVPDITMVVPAPRGELNQLVLAAAVIAGVDRAFSVGGAQAIAALAYGTDLIPRVDKIVGPGNIYVATAKRMLFGTVGIDMIAGPSEILIVCEGETEPDWIAMDMFAQAEHDEHASAILISTRPAFLDAVEASIQRLLPDMERRAIIEQALEKNAALIEVADLDQAAEVVNHIAPEHLELSLAEPMPFLDKVRHAGAIFLGSYSAEALGDYCAGPNHVLPTAGTARFSSPLGVYDFQKRSSLISCDPASVIPLAKTASVLATGEKLTAHARSAEYRIKGHKLAD